MRLNCCPRKFRRLLLQFIYLSPLTICFLYFYFLLPDLKLKLRRLFDGFSEHPYYPYMVFIYSDLGEFGQVCGGTLIHNEFVLTSAHCVFGLSNLTLLLGTNTLSKKEATDFFIESSQVIVHGAFNIETYDNDLALIHLNQHIQETPSIRRANWGKSFFSDGTYSVLGWNILSADDPDSDLLEIRDITIQGDLSRDKIYVGEEHNFCDSVSGGPLFLLADGTHIGVYSGREDECDSTKPTAFINLDYYKNWIENNIKSIKVY